MKSLPRKLLPLTLFGIAVTSLLFVQPVQGFTVTLEQMGANVVATGSGAFNLTGLTFRGSSFEAFRAIRANPAFIGTGTLGGFLDGYTGFTGPTSFGSGGFASGPNTSSGDPVVLDVSNLGGVILVPQGYLSGTTLSDSMTFNNATFASLGVTPGTYVWSWGTGLRNQNFTLIIGGAGVPDGGSTGSLLGCALLGLAALRRMLGC